MVTLTAKTVEKLKPAATRREIPDDGARGLYCIVQPSGRKSFAIRYRFGRRTRKLTLPAGMTLAAARAAAAAALHEVDKGNDPATAKQAARKGREAADKHTFRAVAENYFKREGKTLRSREWQLRLLERLVYPELGDRPINTIKRRAIIELLDQIEDARGDRMAHMALAVIRPIMAWYATRDEDYSSPIVRGMSRVKVKERARKRILSDEELRAVWQTAEHRADPFAFYLRFLLLTSARRDEARRLTWDEIKEGVWTLPARRSKTKSDVVRPLSKAALRLIKGRPEVKDCPFVFTVTGNAPLSSLSRHKRNLDEACGVTGWTLHDCRRTARSLLSRAGVQSDVAERCLGHAVGSDVEQTYDRYQYLDEKRHAFEALAAQIERIVNPAENVVPMRG
jgi:integrase